MSNIFTAIGTFFSKTLPHAIADFFKAAATDGDKIAVAITEGIQTALKSGALNDLALIIEGIFPGVKNIPADLVSQLNLLVPKVLAAELGIQALAPNASEADIQTFTQGVLDAFNVKADKSKLYSTLTGEIYTILRAYTGQSSMTWAEVIAKVEAAFQAYKNDQADSQTAVD